VEQRGDVICGAMCAMSRKSIEIFKKKEERKEEEKKQEEIGRS